MIIDLLRNDLGRVCDYGSIRVAEARQLESYANVHHTTGIITGRLHEKQNRIDLLRACWPGGSITGAPKVRAMEIIAELEQTTRSFYTGAIGYLSIDGNMDLNIAIRTFIASGGKLTYQVGGGIVAESNPAAEYEETIAKAGGMLKALQESSKSGDNNAKNE